MRHPAQSCDLAVLPKRSYLEPMDNGLGPLASGEVHDASMTDEPAGSFGRVAGLLVPIAAVGVWIRLLAFDEAINRQRRWSNGFIMRPLAGGEVLVQLSSSVFDEPGGSFGRVAGLLAPIAAVGV